MYHGSLQQLQLIQQADLAQAEAQRESASSSPAPVSLPGPLILSMAQGWGKLWASLAQRRNHAAAVPGKPRAV